MNTEKEEKMNTEKEEKITSSHYDLFPKENVDKITDENVEKILKKLMFESLIGNFQALSDEVKKGNRAAMMIYFNDLFLPMLKSGQKHTESTDSVYSLEEIKKIGDFVNKKL